MHSAEELRGPKPAAILKRRGAPVLERARYDVADVPLYGPVERDPVRIKVIRDKIGGRPMLSSECGGPSLDYQDSYRPVDHFFTVMERTLMVLSEGLRFCLWYRLGGSGGGHTTPGKREVPLIEDGKPKPGVWAYRLLAVALESVEPVERRGSGLDHYRLHRAGKTPLVVAWKGAGSGATVAPPPGLRGGHVLRVTDAVRGACVVEPLPASGTLRLGPLPLIAGEDLKRVLRLSR